MREYATAEGFRAAVEAKLRDRARHLGVAAYAVRRHAALERLLVRLTTMVAPNRWALKGGLALETRFWALVRACRSISTPSTPLASTRHGWTSSAPPPKISTTTSRSR